MSSSVDRLDHAKSNARPMREFEQLVVRAQMTDVTTPLSIVSLAVRIDRRYTAAPPRQSQCAGEVKRFSEGSISLRS